MVSLVGLSERGEIRGRDYFCSDPRFCWFDAVALCWRASCAGVLRPCWGGLTSFTQCGGQFQPYCFIVRVLADAAWEVVGWVPDLGNDGGLCLLIPIFLCALRFSGMHAWKACLADSCSFVSSVANLVFSVWPLVGPVFLHLVYFAAISLGAMLVFGSFRSVVKTRVDFVRPGFGLWSAGAVPGAMGG